MSCAVGVTSEVGLTTDRDLSVPTCLRNTTYFIPTRYRKSRGTSHYTTAWCFPILVFSWVLLFALLGLYQIVLILSSCYLSLQHFDSVLSVSRFYSWIVLHPVGNLPMGRSHQLVDRIFFHYFRTFCFVSIAWTCLGTFWVSLLSPISFDLFLPLCSQNFWDFFIPLGSCSFYLSKQFYLLQFLYGPSCFISLQVLYFCSGSLEWYLFYHRLVLLLHKLTRSVSWCCPLG